MRTLTLMPLLLLAIAPLPGLDVGQAAPDLSGVSWAASADLEDHDWTLVVWWRPHHPSDSGPIELLRNLARSHGDAVALRAIHVGEAAIDDAAVATRGLATGSARGATLQRWHEPTIGLPMAVLLGPEHRVWWRGELVDAARVVELAAAGEAERAALRRLTTFEDALRAAVRRTDPQQVAAAADALLRFDPGHETARYVKLSLARERGDRHAYQEQLATITAQTHAPRFLMEIAADLISDPDLGWRMPRHARRLAAQAVAASPERPDFLLVRAQVAYALADHDAALEWVDRGLAVAGEDPRLRAYRHYLREVAGLAAAEASGTTP